MYNGCVVFWIHVALVLKYVNQLDNKKAFVSLEHVILYIIRKVNIAEYNPKVTWIENAFFLLLLSIPMVLVILYLKESSQFR